ASAWLPLTTAHASPVQGQFDHFRAATKSDAFFHTYASVSFGTACGQPPKVDAYITRKCRWIRVSRVQDASRKRAKRPHTSRASAQPCGPREHRNRTFSRGYAFRLLAETGAPYRCGNMPVRHSSSRGAVSPRVI